MKSKNCLVAMAFVLSVASAANGQVVSGLMTVTGAEMHWWAGVACDATARLYDVDEDSVVYTRLLLTNKYDQATIAFGARNGNLIDLDKLHESIWATRLSGGTRSGLVSLEVTAIGEVAITEDATILKVADSDAEFVLLRNPDDEHAAVFDALQTAAGSSKVLQVSGRIDNYMGRWPSVLATTPDKPRRILVTGFEIAEAE